MIFLLGEIPKQVKVKKLKNLKTLDSKPGIDFYYYILLFLFIFKYTLMRVLGSYYLPYFLYFLGVYTSYKPYLSRDEEIIKQLQKVIPCSSY